jgi:CMP-N,N'-diacetyllegionaminic acid synthase
MSRSAIAIIPARGGSKGLPGKHLLDLGGKPLIAWTIEAALNAASVERVVVTSDDKPILDLANEMGAEVLHRPAHLATDEVRSEPVILHALEASKATQELTVLLQPTSPLRHSSHVDEALALLTDDVDGIISVTSLEHSPWKCFYVDESGCLRGVVSDEAPFLPRQSLPEAYRPNGAIYAVRTRAFVENGALVGGRTLPYFMPPRLSVDIDRPDDLVRAEEVLKQIGSETLPDKWTRQDAAPNS